MTTFFTSDNHFFHQNVIKYDSRPWVTIEEMNEGLIRNWNSVVKPEDTVYILGDFSLAFRPVEIYPQRLNGTKYLIPGNHDFCHSYNKKSKKSLEHLEKWITKYEENGLHVMAEHSSLDIPGVAVVNMCHIPFSCQDQRYEKFKAINDGRWTLHGHTHSKEKINGREIHVGVTAWDYFPVHIEQVKKLILEQV
jgi:calcineurin-like phosphoesterase family protein